MNAGDYIGIPFVDHGRSKQGCDCWGLVRLIYKQELDIDLTDFSYKSVSDDKRIQQLISSEKKRWNPVSSPQAFDVVVLNISNRPWHVGLMTGPTAFIHAIKNVDSCIQRVRSYQWKQRIEGYYRYDPNISTK